MLASIFDTLDHHTGSVSAFLTLALVLVTAYYALMNRRAVQEMRAARNAAILPHLALEFHRLGPTAVDLAIHNVGPGAALDIDVEVEWCPVDPEADPTRIRWRRNLMSPGEQVELAPHGDLNGNIDVLPRTHRSVLMRGAMKDAGGKWYSVDEGFENITEWRELLKDAHELWRPPEPERRMAEAMAREFKAQDVSRALASIDSTLEARR